MRTEDQHERDSERLNCILAQHRERLIVMADSILHDRHEAEDIVQETATATWKRMSEISPAKLSHYLARAVRQNAIKQKTRRRYHAKLVAEEALPIRDDCFLDPLDLEDAIESLPLTQQNVIRMKYYLGMTFGQIGNSLKISANTAASRCRYALAKLREKVQK